MRRVVVFWFLVLLPVVVSAGRYELIKGQGIEVCEAYLKNLNSFNPRVPMICKRRINPHIKGFEKPKWKKIDAGRAEQLVWEEYKMALKSMGVKLDEKRRIGHREWFREQIRDGGIVLWETEIDINNDGSPDRVVKKKEGDCPSAHAFSVEIFVITKDGKHIDLEESKYINANISDIIEKISEDSTRKEFRRAGFFRNEYWGYTLYDVSIYKGKRYFDFWEMGKEYPRISAARLHVFIRQDNLTREICTFRFVGQ